MALNRYEIRKRLAALLEAFYLDKGVRKVYPYLPATWGGTTPAIGVFASGTGYTRMANTRSYDIQHRFLIYVAVIFGLEDGSWTESQAQDSMDKIVSSLNDFVQEYTSLLNYWWLLEFGEPSDVIPITIDETPYFLEAVPLTVHVKG